MSNVKSKIVGKHKLKQYKTCINCFYEDGRGRCSLGFPTVEVPYNEWSWRKNRDPQFGQYFIDYICSFKPKYGCIQKRNIRNSKQLLQPVDSAYIFEVVTYLQKLELEENENSN